MTTKDELESLFEKASDRLPTLKTGIPQSLEFIDYRNHTREIKIGKEEKHYLEFTFNNVVDIMSEERRPKKFVTSSKRLLRKLFEYFEQGYTCLEITRRGEGIQIDYEIYPITSPTEKEMQE